MSSTSSCNFTCVLLSFSLQFMLIFLNRFSF